MGYFNWLSVIILQILGYYLGFRELSLALADHPMLLLPGGESTTTTGHVHSHSHSSNLGDLHGYHFKTIEVNIQKFNE